MRCIQPKDSVTEGEVKYTSMEENLFKNCYMYIIWQERKIEAG